MILWGAGSHRNRSGFAGASALRCPGLADAEAPDRKLTCLHTVRRRHMKTRQCRAALAGTRLVLPSAIYEAKMDDPDPSLGPDARRDRLLLLRAARGRRRRPGGGRGSAHGRRGPRDSSSRRPSSPRAMWPPKKTLSRPLRLSIRGALGVLRREQRSLVQVRRLGLSGGSTGVDFSIGQSSGIGG